MMPVLSRDGGKTGAERNFRNDAGLLENQQKILTLKIREGSIENSVPQPLTFVQNKKQFAVDFFRKIISTHLLTVLT